MKKIILDKKDFDETGKFISKKYFNAIKNRYEFDGDVEILINYAKFEEGNLYCEGNLNCKGDLYCKGGLHCKGDLYCKGGLHCEGYLYCEGYLHCEGYLYCEGYLNCKGDLYCKGNLNCEGGLHCEGDLNCKGYLYCEGNLNCINILKINSVQKILTTINWGNLSDKLTLEMMRHDAESCGIDKMTIWAKGGNCPFSNSVRDYMFLENRELLLKYINAHKGNMGNPKLRGMELLQALCKDKGYIIKEEE